MSPRVQAEKSQIRHRTPRIPKILSRFELFSKALTKNDLFFDRGFFIAKDAPHISALTKSDLFFDRGFFIDKDATHISALTKNDLLFDRGFFIAHPGNAVDLFRIVFSEKLAFQKLSFEIVFPQYYICFPTSVI